MHTFLFFTFVVGTSASSQLRGSSLIVTGGGGTITASTTATAKQLMIPPIAINRGLRVISYERPPACATSQHSKIGDKLVVDYTGWLCEGPSCAKGKQVKSLAIHGKHCINITPCSIYQQFDSSIGRGPFKFVLGSTPVILAWEAGMQGMCEGEKRKVRVTL
jgi:hypothetical protein